MTIRLLKKVMFFFIFMQSFLQLATAQSKHKDLPFLQEYSEKYNFESEKNLPSSPLKKVICDRNGVIQVLSSTGILKPIAAQLLYPGKLVPDMSSRPMKDKNIKAINIYSNQFVYADDKVVLSNAWAGKLNSKHSIPEVNLIDGDNNFGFLISDGIHLQFIKDAIIAWKGEVTDPIKDIAFDQKRNLFWILSSKSIGTFSAKDKTFQTVLNGESLTSFALAHANSELFVGTHNGYFIMDADTKKQKGDYYRKLPSNDITAIKEIGQNIWFGSSMGAFKLKEDKKYDYYASKRWLPSNQVIDITKGADNAILILTDKGLGKIISVNMTLEQKADFYEKQVRERHLRNGFNASLVGMKDGDPATGWFENSDNDGLWTTMYLGAEVFRYAVTKSPEALQNCRESFEALERLYAITKIPGFPARSYERTGYNRGDTPWRRAAEPDWDWKSTTSSDEAIGHIFAFGAIAELVDDADLKKRAITLIDTLMTHIIDHGYYLIDWHGQPTLWGRWSPEYVNAFPIQVGDRKITASNITAMLQTAYRFTGKKIYKDKAMELLNKHGYLENLMRSMKVINEAPADANGLSKLLSSSWNHSDDEMYFLGYWGLYRYAFNDTLKAKFRQSIIDHWEIERPEKEGAWNIFTSITGEKNFDLKEAIWYLQKYPLDLVNWRMVNSKRNDIERIAPNFREQTTKEVLPPSELTIERHNANRFTLDGGDVHGSSEYSAGDIWLFPYWLGRYLQVISASNK